MSDTLGHTDRVLREIQRELADMRDDRTVMISMLTRHDGSIAGLSVELRALRSQFDRFRNEVREELRGLRDDTKAILNKLEGA